MVKPLRNRLFTHCVMGGTRTVVIALQEHLRRPWRSSGATESLGWARKAVSLAGIWSTVSTRFRKQPYALDRSEARP